LLNHIQAFFEIFILSLVRTNLRALLLLSVLVESATSSLIIPIILLDQPILLESSCKVTVSEPILAVLTIDAQETFTEVIIQVFDLAVKLQNVAHTFQS